jgi:hypothetical protein
LEEGSTVTVVVFTEAVLVVAELVVVGLGVVLVVESAVAAGVSVPVLQAARKKEVARKTGSAGQNIDLAKVLFLFIVLNRKPSCKQSIWVSWDSQYFLLH